jgi:hypothetical protein
MNALIVQNQLLKTIEQSAFSTVPTMTEDGIIRRLLEHPDEITFGVTTLLAILFAVYKVLGPCAERVAKAKEAKLQAEQRLVDAAAEAHWRLPDDIERLERNQALLARLFGHMEHTMSRGCAKDEPPISSTDMTQLESVKQDPPPRKRPGSRSSGEHQKPTGDHQ